MKGVSERFVVVFVCMFVLFVVLVHFSVSNICPCPFLAICINLCVCVRSRSSWILSECVPLESS